jgi:N-methylhydantoinase B
VSVDPISLAVFGSLFASVAEEMGVTLQRASFSANIKERLDFSCALFDGRGRMVAQAAHIPVHLGSMPASVAAALAAFDDLAPGDVVLLNDPYHGGTHLPDVTMVSPVFCTVSDREATRDAGPSFFVASRAHHADVGGMAPGSLPLSRELYQEGIIVPPIKLVEAGRRNEGVVTLLAANSRAPAERLGDLEAQMAAHRVGEQRLRALVATHGLLRMREHAEALMDYARRTTEAAIALIPDGTYRFEDALEGDGQGEACIPIRVAITVEGSAMTVDFQGSAAQVAGNLNAVEAVVRSATWYCVHLVAQRLLGQESLPVNHGSFAPVTVAAPAHSVLSPDFPAAVAVGNVETSQRIVDVVLGALAEALPELLPAASQGTMNNVAFGGHAGGRPFIFYETIGGGHGAGPAGDGISGRHSHMTNTRNTPVEALEHDLPVRVLEYRLRLGSGGEGRHRGGEGIRRTFEFLAPATVTVNSERRRYAPYGLRGGRSGRTGANKLVSDGEERDVGAKATIRVQPGDRLIVETPGGGGWGEGTPMGTEGDAGRTRPDPSGCGGKS